jgi:ribosomal protein S27AE
MRTWASEALVESSQASDAHFAALAERWPEVPSAYVPSGKLPWSGLVALLGGGVLATVAAALTGVLVTAVSLALFTAMGFVIAVVAACGFVACIMLVWGLGIALVGGGLTFGGLGRVAGALTAWFGKLGKSRNVLAPIVLGFVATFVAWAALASLPSAVASLVPPSDADFSVGGLVHLFGDYGWVHVVVLLVGLAFALVMAFVGAEGTVKAQKFCEPCDVYMADKQLRGASLVAGEQLCRSLAVRDMPPIVDLLATDSGSDLEPSLHRCPRCGAGYLEAKVWARTKWKEGKDDKSAERTWLALSTALRPEHALPLSRLSDR